MNEPTQFRADEIRAIRAAYAALNRNDVDGFVASFDGSIERIEPSDSPHGGVFRGVAAVREHVSRARETWAEGGCEPEEFKVAGDRIMALVQVRVRLKSELAWREGRAWDVFTFRDGKVIQFRTFFDGTEAMAWMGCSSQGPA